MATLASNPAYRTVSAEEFVEMNFGDAKAELVDGFIYMPDTPALWTRTLRPSALGAATGRPLRFDETLRS